MTQQFVDCECLHKLEVPLWCAVPCLLKPPPLSARPSAITFLQDVPGSSAERVAQHKLSMSAAVRMHGSCMD